MASPKVKDSPTHEAMRKASVGKVDDFQPRRNKDGSLTIYLRVISCSPDGVQYKPYASQFEPVGDIYIPVTVAEKHVIQATPHIVLTPTGWFSLMKAMATGSTLAAGGN